jgi:hypothetical protein
MEFVASISTQQQNNSTGRPKGKSPTFIYHDRES